MLVAAGTGILAAISVKTAAAAVIGLVTVLAAIFRPVVVVLILFLTVYPSTLTLGGISIQRLGGPLALLVAVAQLLRGGVHMRRPTLTLVLVVAYVALVLIAGSIPASLSRGGMVALILTGVVIAIIPSVYLFTSGAQKRKFFLGVAAMSIALMAIAGATLSQRFEQAFNDPSGGAGRGDLALAALHGFHDHPLLGMGFGAFPPNSFQLLRSTPGVYLDLHLRCLANGSTVRAAGSFCTGQPVHNTYVESLVELGIPGVLLFCGVLVAAGWSLMRTAPLALVATDQFSACVVAAPACG